MLRFRSVISARPLARPPVLSLPAAPLRRPPTAVAHLSTESTMTASLAGSTKQYIADRQFIALGASFVLGAYVGVVLWSAFFGREPPPSEVDMIRELADMHRSLHALISHAHTLDMIVEEREKYLTTRELDRWTRFTGEGEGTHRRDKAAKTDSEAEGSKVVDQKVDEEKKAA